MRKYRIITETQHETRGNPDIAITSILTLRQKKTYYSTAFIDIAKYRGVSSPKPVGKACDYNDDAVIENTFDNVNE